MQNTKSNKDGQYRNGLVIATVSYKSLFRLQIVQYLHLGKVNDVFGLIPFKQ